MSDDEMPPTVNDETERAAPEQVRQQAERSQENAAVQPIQRTAPGRRPLYRS
jgi:hypothetical protein